MLSYCEKKKWLRGRKLSKISEHKKWPDCLIGKARGLFVLSHIPIQVSYIATLAFWGLIQTLLGAKKNDKQ